MCKRFLDIIRMVRLVRCAAVLFISIVVLFTSPYILFAQTVVTSEKHKSGIALPGEKCRVHPLDEWTEPEKWAWKQICEGRNADFNKRLGEILDPRIPKHKKKWTDGRRTLSSSFLRTILLYKPFRSAIPNWGVRIFGAYFHFLNLSDASIEWPLVLHRSIFNSQVSMSHLVTSRLVSFFGSTFAGKLTMDSSSIGSSLFMREAQFQEVDLRGLKVGIQLSMNKSKFTGKLTLASTTVGGSLHVSGAQFKEVDLRSSKISDQLNLNSSTFAGKLILASATIGSSLQLRGAQFKEVELRGLRVGDTLEMINSTFEGTLIMDSASIGNSLFMQGTQFKVVDLRSSKVGGQVSMKSSTFAGKFIFASGTVGRSLIIRFTQFKEVDMRGLKIDGQLEVDGSKFNGTLNMNNSSIGSSLFMRNATFDKLANLTFLRIGSNFDARGATLSGLDLRGTRIEGELRLGQGMRAKKTEWKGSFPIITLRNVKVGALQDTKDSWPDNLEREFEGFIYQRLGGLGMNKKKTPYERSSEWFINWLERDKTYSPQPYLQLASVLRTAGYEDKADDILYANRERQRSLPGTSPGRWFLLSLLKETIGYGYGLGYFQALRWVLGLVLLGAFFLRINEEDLMRETLKGNKIEMLGLWYSLDMLLPVIRLRQKHYEVDLETQWVRIYFYIHKIMGYVLIFFVIAGLTGLTEWE